MGLLDDKTESPTLLHTVVNLTGNLVFPHWPERLTISGNRTDRELWDLPGHSKSASDLLIEPASREPGLRHGGLDI